MTATDGISVVMPTKNRADAVTGKVRWALTRPAVTQVVVVVDGSTDDTVEQLRHIGDPRLEVIVHSRSLGAPRAKNTGLARVTAPWVAILDDDDQHSEGFMEVLRDVAMEHDLGVAAAPWLNVTSGIDPAAAFTATARTPGGPVLGRPDLVPASGVAETIWAPANFVVRRDVIESGIRYDPGYRYNFWREETDFFIRSARAGHRVGVTSRAYSYIEGRAGGGIDRRGLLYEVWTVLNDIRLMRLHGDWMRRNGYIDSTFVFVVANASARARMRLRPLVRRLKPKGATAS